VSDRHEIRGLVIAGLSGVVAPFVLTALLGLFTLHVWSPTVRYLSHSHGVAFAKLAVAATTPIDVMLGALLGVAAGFGIGRLTRARYLSPWLAFVAFFALTAGLPALIDGQYDLTVFFFTRPVIITFLALSVVGFWLAGKRKEIAHVA
jgi:hypothetical protein